MDPHTAAMVVAGRSIRYAPHAIFGDCQAHPLLRSHGKVSPPLALHTRHLDDVAASASPGQRRTCTSSEAVCESLSAYPRPRGDRCEPDADAETTACLLACLCWPRRDEKVAVRDASTLSCDDDDDDDDVRSRLRHPPTDRIPPGQWDGGCLRWHAIQRSKGQGPASLSLIRPDTLL
ncbi:uncharacterized protein PSFLO_01374 [Pseudozyma flocculosa]|uniref:Uncharacterized protein n=1 Tax=Pseudozyma flocculosa TaxID=84751 RepID=A0A5C3EU82_9BASI|nr:uncharacterized protein PSFLO_01374 [Pseudozyma flocculosa]